MNPGQIAVFSLGILGLSCACNASPVEASDVKGSLGRVILQGFEGVDGLAATARVRAIQLSQDGRLLAIARGRHVHILDGNEYRTIAKLTPYPEQNVQAIAFSPDGKQLVTGADDALDLVSWKTDDWTMHWRVTEDVRPNPVESIQFSPNGEAVAAAHFRTVFLFDAQDGKEIAKLDDWPQFHGRGAYRQVFFTSDRELWAIGSRSQILGWDLHTKKVRVSAASADLHFMKAEISKMRQETIVAGQTEIAVLEMADWSPLARMRIPDSVNAWDMALHAERGLVAHASTRLRIMDQERLTVMYDERATRGAVTVSAMSFDGDGGRIVFGDSSGWVRVVELPDLVEPAPKE